MKRRPVIPVLQSTPISYPSSKVHLPPAPAPSRRNRIQDGLDVTRYETRRAFLRALTHHVKRTNSHHLFNDYVEEYNEWTHLLREEARLLEEERVLGLAERLDATPMQAMEGTLSPYGLDALLTLYEVDQQIPSRRLQNFPDKDFGLTICSPRLCGTIRFEDRDRARYHLFCPPSHPGTDKNLISATRHTSWMDVIGEDADLLHHTLTTNPIASPGGVMAHRDLLDVLLRLGVTGEHLKPLRQGDTIHGYAVDHPEYHADIAFTDDPNKVFYSIWTTKPHISASQTSPKPTAGEEAPRRYDTSHLESRLFYFTSDYPDYAQHDWRIDRALEGIETLRDLPGGEEARAYALEVHSYLDAFEQDTIIPLAKQREAQRREEEKRERKEHYRRLKASKETKKKK